MNTRYVMRDYVTVRCVMFVNSRHIHHTVCHSSMGEVKVGSQGYSPIPKFKNARSAHT